MGGRRKLLKWSLASIFLVIALLWHKTPGYAAQQTPPSGLDGSALPKVDFSGKLTLGFSCTFEDNAYTEIAIPLAVDGKARIPLAARMYLDVTAGAKPHPRADGVLGYTTAKFVARQEAGFGLDLYARMGRSLESNGSGGGEECVSSTLSALFAHRPRGGVAWKLSYASREYAYPYRPTRDREEKEASCTIEGSLSQHLSLKGELSRLEKQYHLAAHNSSITGVASLESRFGLSKALKGEVVLESKSMRYPASPSKTYMQISWEVGGAYEPGPGLTIGGSVSSLEKGFPWRPAKDLRDLEVILTARARDRNMGTLTFKGTTFQRTVPAAPEKAYRKRLAELKYQLPVLAGLETSVGWALSRRLHAEPAARREDHDELQVTWGFAYDLDSDLRITGEVEMKRRDYPFRESKNTRRLKSAVALVYRF